MRTIRRYVAVQVFWSTALVFVALLLLFAFFDFIQELGDIGRRFIERTQPGRGEVMPRGGRGFPGRGMIPRGFRGRF